METLCRYIANLSSTFRPFPQCKVHDEEHKEQAPGEFESDRTQVLHSIRFFDLQNIVPELWVQTMFDVRCIPYFWQTDGREMCKTAGKC